MRFEGQVHIRHCYTLSHWQKLTDNNRGYEKVNSGLQHALNLIYAHKQFYNFPRGLHPDPVQREKGEEETGNEAGERRAMK
jgi:hypothetical protein